MKTLPANVKPYQRTNIFTRETIPAGLLRDHQLKTGTWGKIQVSKGTLMLTILGEQTETVELNKNQPGIIPPQVLHQVEAKNDVEFFVEFYRE